MIVNLADYKFLKHLVQLKLNMELDKSDRDLIRDISIPNKVPLIAVVYYFAKAKGYMSEDLKVYVQELLDFYHYDQVVGYDEI